MPRERIMTFSSHNGQKSCSVAYGITRNQCRVLWGTLFPVLSEAVRGIKISVAAPFFNQVNVLLGLALLILSGVCPLIGVGSAHTARGGARSSA